MEQFVSENRPEINNEKKAQEYILRYTNELKLHFNLNDNDMKKILYKAYSQMQGENVVQKWLDMVKFFLLKLCRKNYDNKKTPPGSS